MAQFTSLQFWKEPINAVPSVTQGCSRLHGYAKHLGYTDIRLNITDQRHLYSFAFVRNPYSRLVSHYKFMKRNYGPAHEYLTQWVLAHESETFSGFVERIAEIEMLRPLFMQACYFCNEAGDVLVDAVYKHESIDSSIDLVRAALRRQNLIRYLLHRNAICAELPKVYVADRGSKYNWREEYSAETASIVFSLSRRDFEMFHYDPDSWIGKVDSK
jgi:hypothetical protein